MLHDDYYLVQNWLQNKEPIGDKDVKRIYAIVLSEVRRAVRFPEFRRKDYYHEIANQAFAEAWSQLGSYRGESSLSTWISVIARRHLYKRNTSEEQARATNVSFNEAYMQGIDTDPYKHDPLTILLIREMWASIFYSIRILRSHQYRVIYLHYVDGLTFTKIEKLTGISSNTLRQHHFRAIVKIKKTYIRSYEKV